VQSLISGRDSTRESLSAPPFEPDLIELVTAFFTGYSDLTRQLLAFCEFTPRFPPKPAKLGERIQKLNRTDNCEKSYPTKLNRKDLEDRKEDIFVGSVLIVHARSCAGFHS
jgi:hypothetical protein